MRYYILLLVVAVLLNTAHASSDSQAIVVFVSRSHPSDTIDRDTLRLIFQTRKTTWDGMEQILPLNAPLDSSLRKGFDAAVLGLDPERVQRYWIDRKIRGGARPPQEVPDGAMAQALAQESSQVISYDYEKNVDKKAVKIVATISNGKFSAH